MRSKAFGVCCITVCCIVLYLASTTGRSSAQDRVVAAAKGDEKRTVQVESATVEIDESDAPIEFVPIPPGTVYERDVVWGEGAYATAAVPEQLIYSNTLGTFGAALGKDKLVADDITTTVPDGCNLVRYEFPVVGKVNPTGTGGSYTIDFAMYTSCPQSVPFESRPGLIIPGTNGRRTFLEQCLNAVNDDPLDDTVVNDGCPAVGPPETGAQCLNAIDDDGDGRVNDGCPVVGLQGESYVDSVPRIISFVAASNIALKTNMWFGVQFSRNNAGVVVGTPPLTGFSCDKYDYPGFPCDSDAGGFPDQPQASFNLEIFADPACVNSYTGYKNDKPSGTLYNPGANIFLADDIQLSASGCNMIAYEVAVRGDAFYTFKMQNNCQSGLIAGTEQNFSISGSTDVQIARFTFFPAIPIPQNLSFQASVNNTAGSVVIAGQQACIGFTADRLDTVVAGVCNIVPPGDPPNGYGIGVQGAIDLVITCAGAAPVGACCDMFITDENNDSVCREVPKTNCPFPERFTADRPVWVQVAPKCNGGPRNGLSCDENNGDADCAPNGICTRCAPDPFSPHPCGQAACCKPDGTCANLTRNQCYAVPPLDSPRKWDLGRYCGSEGQRCPIIACLARNGECTTQRCLHNTGVCTKHCTGGLNPGTLCTSAANCRVCTNKKCSGSPLNTVCIGTGQGTCPAGQTCDFNTCTADSGCLRVCSNKQCSGSPLNTVCTGTGQSTCPAGQTCDFITCTSNTPCTPTGGTCQTSTGTCPTGGACNTPPTATEICTSGLIGQACRFSSDCNCPDRGCQVNSTCCDSCPPVGCEDPDCCTDVCNIFDSYCCDVEWDDACASQARTGLGPGGVPICNIRPANDVCAPVGRMEGARLMTTVPPSSFESDSGRATEDASDPGFGCYLNNPGNGGLQTVWYKFVATDTSALLQTCNSNSPALDSLLEVFACGDPTSAETCCATLIPIGCSDDVAGCSGGHNSKLCLQRLTVGNTYYVMVASKIALLPGKAYRLDISAPCPTPSTIGDFCPDAQTILKKCSGAPANTICTGTGQGTCPVGQTCDLEGPTPTPAFNLADATMTAPVELCIPTMTNDKWYKYTATCSGTLSVEACGTVPGTTTNLAIYKDCLCPPIAGDPICRSALDGPNCGIGSELKVDVVQGSCYGIRLADDAENRPSGNLKLACVQVDCPAGEITITDPPDRVVDAARPHDPNNAALLEGIKVITATGPRDALPSCFSLCETPTPCQNERDDDGDTVVNDGCPAVDLPESGAECLNAIDDDFDGIVNDGCPAVGPAETGNVIDSVVQNPIGTYTITLHHPITAGALTTITYTDSRIPPVQSVGRFTSNPGNVKADVNTSETDVQDLINVLNGTTSLVWGNYSGDINRSSEITPADILEVVDLINGGGAYDPWDGAINQNNSTCPP